MNILHPSWFASIVSSDKGNLEKISLYIEKYLGKDNKEAFNTAWRKLDYNTANRIIDNAIICMTGNKQDTVSSSIMSFIRKFPKIEAEIKDELEHAVSDSERIKIIDRYYSTIKNTIGLG